jgi:signal transduction histidine kinase
VRGGVRRLWVLGFLVLTLVVVYAAFLYLYTSYRDRLEEELGARLIAVAAASAAAVDGDVWTALATGDSAAIAGIRSDLERVRRQSEVADIFLFDAEETTLFDLGGVYPVGKPNLALSLDLQAAVSALAGLPAATRLYSNEGVYLKTGYAPVLAADGSVRGGVGVEASATFFQPLGQVKRTLVGAALLVLVGMSLLAVGFARLLGARERLEERLRRTETLAGMGQMTAMLAHEIRNPLGIIRAAAERLGERHGLQEEELFRFIPEEVDRLGATLESYLEFARAGGGEGEEDLADTLRKTAVLVAPELERKGTLLEVDIGEGTFPVRADPHRLRQVFLNLFLNAMEATGKGGRLQVSLARQGRGVEVRFRDNGSGMTEDVRRRAAEPFFTTKETGSGLGLAVVARTVDELGGRLVIRSEPGAGTEIGIRVPLARTGRRVPKE